MRERERPRCLNRSVCTGATLECAGLTPSRNGDPQAIRSAHIHSHCGEAAAGPYSIMTLSVLCKCDGIFPVPFRFILFREVSQRAVTLSMCDSSFPRSIPFYFVSRGVTKGCYSVHVLQQFSPFHSVLFCFQRCHKELLSRKISSSCGSVPTR